jgi:crotonobetainyl-CoA:carnitine CoA-transferase CaiB-like acyl-CoA transferase
MGVESDKRPFGRINVVECGDGISAAFGAKMLADLGANVVKVEPPGGDSTRRRGPFPADKPEPDKSGLYIYLNANKRGVTADLTRQEGRDLLDKLLERADVLIHNVHPRDRERFGLNSPALCAKYPKLIVTSISMFGDTGPRANWRAYELNVANAGGWAYLSPGTSDRPDLPPLKASGAQCNFQSGVHAAMVMLAAYRSRMKSGKGQAIDVSEQECTAGMGEQTFAYSTYAGQETSRLGRRVLGPWFITDCSDGKIFLICVEENQWQRLVEFMGNPEWAREEIFKDRIARGTNSDALLPLMTGWIAGWKHQELFREGQARGIPFAPVNTMQESYEDEHLRERNFFVTLEQPGIGMIRMPGQPSKYGRTRWALKRPAPRLGEHSEQIFCGELGIPMSRFAELKATGVV